MASPVSEAYLLVGLTLTHFFVGIRNLNPRMRYVGRKQIDMIGVDEYYSLNCNRSNHRMKNLKRKANSMHLLIMRVKSMKVMKRYDSLA